MYVHHVEQNYIIAREPDDVDDVGLGRAVEVGICARGWLYHINTFI